MPSLAFNFKLFVKKSIVYLFNLQTITNRKIYGLGVYMSMSQLLLLLLMNIYVIFQSYFKFCK